MDDELRLDGNAAAGSLREIFSFELPPHSTPARAAEGPIGSERRWFTR